MRLVKKIGVSCLVFLILLFQLLPLSAFALSWEMEEWKIEDWEIEEWKQEEWKLYDWEVDQWELDKWQLEQWEINQWELENNLPQSINDGNSSGDSTDSNSENNQISDDDSEESDSKGASKEQKDDESFISFKTPELNDVLGFTKDMLGETVDLSYRGITEGPLTNGDFWKSKANILNAGFKMFVQDDQSLVAGDDLVTAFGYGQDLHDSWKFFNEYRQISNLRSAGDIITAASRYTDLLNQTKTISPGNAIISTVTMPFTVAETVGNVNKLINASDSETMTDAAWDLAGNTGSLLTGAAPLVALIPGAQPLAVGLFAVGTVISLASVGRKLYKNRKEIVADVKKKYGIAKKKIGNFFNSIFK